MTPSAPQRAAEEIRSKYGCTLKLQIDMESIIQKHHAPLIEAAEKVVQDCDNEIRLGGQVCCDHEALRKAIAEAKGEKI